MGYIETLELGGLTFGNPGFCNTSVEAHIDAQDAKRRNKRFLNALWAAYPDTKPVNVPLDPRIADAIPNKSDFNRLEHLAAERAKAAEQYARIVKAHAPISERTIKTVADWFGLLPSDLTGRSRISYIISARFVAMRLLFDVQQYGTRRFSYPMIGRFFGGRDHSTVLHALRTFDDRARAYPEMIEAYEALKDA